MLRWRFYPPEMAAACRAAALPGAGIAAPAAVEFGRRVIGPRPPSSGRASQWGAMFTIFLLGNIASGKSCAARYLERAHGAYRIDLDELAKGLYQPGSQLVADIADAFGWDVLDEGGGIRRPVLAARAFASPEETARLNAIVHPVLLEQLGHRLLPANCCSTIVPDHPLAVVEVSAPRGFTDAFGLADGVIAITAPEAVRRARAIGRGMDAADFDRRAEVQPDEAELAAMADLVIDNTAADDGLFRALDAYLAERGISAEPVEPADYAMPAARPAPTAAEPSAAAAEPDEPTAPGDGAAHA